MSEPPRKRACVPRSLEVFGGGLVDPNPNDTSLASIAPVLGSYASSTVLPLDNFGSTLMNLVDLCLLSLCSQHAPKSKRSVRDAAPTLFFHRSAKSDYIRKLPQHLRERLNVLFLHNSFAQANTHELGFARSPQLMDEELAVLPQLKNLALLDFSWCDTLTGMALAHVAQLPALAALRVSHCTHVALGFAFLAGGPVRTTLKTLDAGFCEIQDPVVAFIGSLVNLEELNLSCNRLSDASSGILSSLTKLEHLNLSMNPLLTDTALADLARLPCLRALNINFCTEISSTGLAALSSSAQVLSKIDMNGCDRVLTNIRQRPLVLLAEDNKVQARMISMVLNRYNYDVEVAADGALALSLFTGTRKFDLILMDLVMPGMDGLSCLKAIRSFEQDHSLPRTPVIIQTADMRDEQRDICLAAGCDRFIRKPLDRSCITIAKELIGGSSIS